VASVRTQREIRQRAPIWLVGLLVTNLVIMAVDARDADGRQKVLRIWTQTFASPLQNASSKATGATSGFFVVDIDGDDGEATLRLLEATHGALPPTVEVITGKGRHCYFRLREHGVIGNTASTIGLGIDTRGEGGYVLAPPSVHPSGRSYAWSVDSAAEFAEAPEWIYQLIGAHASGQGKPLEHWHSVLTHKIANGTRNTTLASIAGKLLFHDVNVALIYDLLLCVNEARCDTPLTAGEVESIVLSVGRTHFGRWT